MNEMTMVDDTARNDSSGAPQAVVDYSIVIPVYYNEGSLSLTIASLKSEVIDKNIALRCEIICVDDGSGDGSLAELLRLRKQYPKLVRVVKLTRNFGQVCALMAGFSIVRGRCIVVLSADGQDPPGLVNEMLKAHLDESMEIVICTREGRDESYYRRLTSKLFYWLMRKLSFPNMPGGGFDYLLLGRRALDVLLRNQEAHPFFQGQILWMGFKTKFIKYHRREREVGTSRWTFGKKVTALIDGVMSYSFMPIRFMSVAGVVVALLGFLYAIAIFVGKLVWGNPVPGMALLPILILVLGGFQLLTLGIIGEYLWRTLAQVRNRELYVIDEIYDD